MRWINVLDQAEMDVRGHRFLGGVSASRGSGAWHKILFRIVVGHVSHVTTEIWLRGMKQKKFNKIKRLLLEHAETVKDLGGERSNQKYQQWPRGTCRSGFYLSLSLSLSVSMIQSVFKYETQTGHNQGSISCRK